MLPFIKEENTLWEYLKTAGKPVVLYGTGDGADKVITRLGENGIVISGIFASDEFVRGQQFHGFTVRKYSELLALRENMIVLIAFASELPEMLDRFYKLSEVHETYAPHVPIFSGDLAMTPEWLKKYETELQTVYDRLADAASRKTFAAILNYKLSGKLSYMQECTTKRGDDMKELFSFGEEETYVDAGAYDGDTVQEFLTLAGYRYKQILALEPDPKNFKKLTDFVRQNGLNNVRCLQAGVWNECGILELNGNGGRQSTFRKSSAHKKVKQQPVNVVSVDAVLGNEHADYMKFDVEGVEKEALTGAARHLVPDCNGVLPKLLVAAYHHDEDRYFCSAPAFMGTAAGL